MASRILPLHPTFNGLSAIVNVNGRVGPGEPNDAGDVRVVQRLMQMGGKGSAVATKIGLPAVTGQYDAATGFWIYHIQFVQTRSHPHQVVDGVVSPAHGANYSPATHWAIVMLNDLAHKNNPAEFATFLASGGA